jgi:Ligand-binding domain of nuclear hormone receptor
MKEEQPPNDLLIIDPAKVAQETDADDSISCSDDEDTSALASDKNLFEKCCLKFELGLPQDMAGPPSIHFVSETASRLLFKTVHWIKSIPSFSLLKSSTQIDLVQQSWSALFVLGLAQISKELSLSSLLSLVVSHQQACLSRDPRTNVKDVIQTVCNIHKYVNTLTMMKLDDEEYAYLKAIVLFSDGGSCSRVGISQLQDAALAQLQEYLIARGRERTRFPKLLLLLSMPRSLHPLAIEKLFFTGIVGSIQIQTVLPYILQMKEGLDTKKENQTDEVTP